MRRLYIDNIRWMTVVLVVLYHVIYMFNGIETFGVIGPFSGVQYQDTYQYLVYPWFMLLLFVVSGMSARYALERQTHGAFLKSRTRKLLVPSTLGLLAFWWILGYYNMLLSGALDSLANVPKPVLFVIMAASGIGPLWYIQMLWVFSVILVWVRKIEKDKLWALGGKATVPFVISLALVVWGAAQILNTPMIVVYRFGIYGLGFFLGYFIFSHDEVMERLEKCWLLLLVCALAVAVAGFAGAYLAYEIISRIPMLRWLICGMGGKIVDIKPGDNLLVLGDEGQGLAIMKEQGLLDMLKAIRS